MIESKSEYQISLRQVNEITTLLHELTEGQQGDQCTMVNLHRKLSRLHSKISNYLSDTIDGTIENIESNDN